MARSRAGNPESKTTTVVLAVLVVLGLVAYVLWSDPPAPVASLPGRFLEFERSAVDTVDVKTVKGTVRLERDAADRERWRVEVDGTLVRADSVRVEDFLNELSRLAPRARWKKDEVTPEERKKWGMDEPRETVILGLGAGEPLRAAFGADTSERTHVYAERNGDGEVWVVPRDAMTALEELAPADLREKSPLGFSSYDLKELIVSRKGGAPRFALVKEPGGTWRVTSPYAGAADPEGVEGLVARVLGVKVREFVADGAVDRDRYGLLDPRAEVTVRRQGEERTTTLLFGNPTTDGQGVYFMEEGEPSIYACSPDLPAALEKLDPAALRDRNALRLGWSRLDSIAFRHGDVKWKLLRVMERWDVEEPQRVPAEGPAVDALLERLRGLEVASFVEGSDAGALGLSSEEDAPAVLILEGTDDAGDRHLLLGEKREDGRVAGRLLDQDAPKTAPGTLFLLPGDFLDRLDEGWLSFKDREVLKVDLAEVRALTRRAGGREETWYRTEGGWKGKEGGPEPDAEALTRALSRLLSVRCASWAGRDRVEERAPYGLDGEGTIAITLHLGLEGQPERTETLILGGPAEGGTAHYARMEKGEFVFVLEDRVVQGSEILPFHGILTAPWSKAPPPDGE